MSDLEDRASELVEQSKREDRRTQRLLGFDLATYRRPYVTASALAAYLDCDVRTIVRMITDGALDAVKVGRGWRIPTDAAREKFHVKQKHAS